MSDFQYGFRPSRSTANLLTVVSDRVARALNRSVATRPVVSEISKAFDRVWHSALLHKLKSYGISDQIFGLISCSLDNRRLRTVLDGKMLSKILLYMMMILLYSMCNQASNLQQQLEVASELDSNL